MRGRFITKHIDNRKPQLKNVTFVKKASDNTINETKAEVKTVEPKVEVKVEPIIEPKVDKEESNKVMTTSEKIEMAQNVLNGNGTKRIKKDKGLIERTESSKTILTEDNKELLKD